MNALRSQIPSTRPLAVIGQSFEIYFSNFAPLMKLVCVTLTVPVLYGMLLIRLFFGPNASAPPLSPVLPEQWRIALYLTGIILYFTLYAAYHIAIVSWVRNRILFNGKAPPVHFTVEYKPIVGKYIAALLLAGFFVNLATIPLENIIESGSPDAKAYFTDPATILLVLVNTAIELYVRSGLIFTLILIIVERKGVWSSVKRSWTMSRGNRWKIISVFAIMAVMILIVGLIIVISVLLYLPGNSLVDGDVPAQFRTAAGFGMAAMLLVLTFFSPVPIISAVLLYLENSRRNSEAGTQSLQP